MSRDVSTPRGNALFRGDDVVMFGMLLKRKRRGFSSHDLGGERARAARADDEL
jgi:hypothetical protein